MLLAAMHFEVSSPFSALLVELMQKKVVCPDSGVLIDQHCYRIQFISHAEDCLLVFDLVQFMPYPDIHRCLSDFLYAS